MFSIAENRDKASGRGGFQFQVAAESHELASPESESQSLKPYTLNRWLLPNGLCGYII